MAGILTGGTTVFNPAVNAGGGAFTDAAAIEDLGYEGGLGDAAQDVYDELATSSVTSGDRGAVSCYRDAIDAFLVRLGDAWGKYGGMMQNAGIAMPAILAGSTIFLPIVIANTRPGSAEITRLISENKGGPKAKAVLQMAQGYLEKLEGRQDSAIQTLKGAVQTLDSMFEEEDEENFWLALQTMALEDAARIALATSGQAGAAAVLVDGILERFDEHEDDIFNGWESDKVRFARFAADVFVAAGRKEKAVEMLEWADDVIGEVEAKMPMEIEIRRRLGSLEIETGEVEDGIGHMRHAADWLLLNGRRDVEAAAVFLELAMQLTVNRYDDMPEIATYYVMAYRLFRDAKDMKSAEAALRGMVEILKTAARTLI